MKWCVTVFSHERMNNSRTFLSVVIIVAGIMTACAPSGAPGSSPSSSSQARVPASYFSYFSSLASQSSSSSKVWSASLASSIATLPVPFTPQAPFANWDALHEEACEEAAILMVVHFLNGTPLNPEIAERAIQDLTTWERQHGYSDDVNAAQIAEIASAKFGLRARVRTDVTEETIREELAAGNPVIIPAAGRDLGNPYFSGEGPWYHTLVIIGYREGWTGDWFITNDPGTKRGKGYAYRVETLLQAIHDWTGVKEEIRSGGKAMVILEK